MTCLLFAPMPAANLFALGLDHSACHASASIARRLALHIIGVGVYHYRMSYNGMWSRGDGQPFDSDLQLAGAVCANR